MSQRHVQAIGINLRLSTDLKADTLGGGLGVVDSLGTSLDVRADTVVVACSESAQVTETVEGDGVLGGTVAEGSSVTSDLALSNVVRGLGTEEETVTTENGVSSESGALKGKSFASIRRDGRLRALFKMPTLKRSRKARVWRPGCL